MSLSNHIESTHNCDTIRSLIPEYAFGLTSPEETRLVEVSIANCPEAAAQLADYRRIQEQMRENSPQIEPPTALGDRLLAAITAPDTAIPSQRSSFSLAWFISAAALIALVFTNVYWLTRVDNLTHERDQLAAINLPEGNDAFILTSTSDLRWVRLPPSQEDMDASAFLMWNAESEIGLLYVRGFPGLDTGKTYQLWLTRDEGRVSGGTFRVDQEGNGALLFHITEPIDQYTWARITNEPESGSDQPTGTVVVVGEL